MAEMSPLAKLLMKVLQKGSWGAGALCAIFACILLYQRYTPDGFVFKQGDIAFFSVLAVLLLLAIYLVRGIAKEIRENSGGENEH
jgi:hypothetical protein